MHKYSMWKPEIDNQKFTPIVPSMEGQQKKNKGNIKTLWGTDCEVERFEVL